MTPAELNQLVVAIRDHLWLVVASLSVNLLVRLAKTDAAVRWFPVNLRPKVRPYAAIILGGASGVVAALSSHMSWPTAIAGGLVAGMMAITTHDVVIESIRDGRDIGVPKAKTIPPPAPMFPPVEP